VSPPAYTPGPWRASIGTLVRVVAGPLTICGVHKSGRFTGDHDPRETEANANLIAAAPDYDAAARCFVQWAEHARDIDIPPNVRSAMEAAFGAHLRAAMAKALGADEASEKPRREARAP
jgi:hypothetical protein